MSYIIGIDLGTSSLKGIVVTKTGKVLASYAVEYSLSIPQPGYSEQNPQIWLDALDQVLIHLIKDRPEIADKIAGISFSGQMHTLVLLGEQNQPLRPAILWNDVRTTKQCKTIMDTAGEKVTAQTKNRALEGFTLPKLLWVKENEPEIWEQAAQFLLPKDYLGFYLTGNKQMEYSDAAGTLLLEVEARQWSTDLADIFEIPAKIFPRLVSSSDKIGTVKKELAQKYGFKTEVPVFSGGADNACAAIGAGIIKAGVGLVSIGTSGVFLSYEADALQDYQGNLHYFNHAVKDSFYSMGVTLAAGYSLNWFKKTFAPDQSYETLLAGMQNLPIGSEGLLFTPYLMGERTPYIYSRIRGSFIGITARHTLKHFAKAVVEGITFSLKDSQNLMEKYADRTFDKIVSVGGGAKNQDWLQMQADIFRAQIVTLKSEQGPALGAAMIAAVGVGWFKSMTECAKVFVEYDRSFLPNEKNSADYQKIYALYHEVYPATKNLSHQLGGI